MSSPTHEGLHSINEHLQATLEQWSRVPGGSAALLPETLHELLAQLSRAAELLRSLPADLDATLESEVSSYRCNVERLQEVLPLIHNRLLSEKARLESARAHLQAAAAWADASKKAL